MGMTIAQAKDALEAAGYVVVKARTYRNLQERVRSLRASVEFEERATASAERWARDALAEQRRLADRITFVYGEARAAGCTVEQLAGGGSAEFPYLVENSGGHPIARFMDMENAQQFSDQWLGLKPPKVEAGR